MSPKVLLRERRATRKYRSRANRCLCGGGTATRVIIIVDASSTSCVCSWFDGSLLVVCELCAFGVSVFFCVFISTHSPSRVLWARFIAQRRAVCQDGANNGNC